jgi:predicted GIY-YIG superfamily endonuclease
MNRAWVYITLCSDGTYYVGSTTDLEQRIIDHYEGRYEGYTSTRLPVKLLWSSEYSDIRYAFEYERKIKKWSRAKKEALMKGDYDQPHLLSRSTVMKGKIDTK